MPIAEFLGIRMVADQPKDAWAAEMEIVHNTLNLFGSAHGGAIATLIDWSAGWGALNLTGRAGATTDMHIRYLAAAREGSTLRATTTVDRTGASTIALTVRVVDEAGRLIAIGNLGYRITYRILSS